MATDIQRQGATSLPEVFRARVRGRIAELYLTHEDVAHRLEQFAPRVLGSDHRMRTGARKVSHVVAGQAYPKFNELEVWATALETTEAYLLGFTWDPRPPVVASSTEEAMGR